MSGPLDLIGPGEVVFDIGANGGHHARRYLAVGARVVCVEPLPRFHHELAALGPRAHLVPAAIGAEDGVRSMWESRRYPHLSTLSDRWRDISGYLQLHGQDCWDRQINVQVWTLDDLIAAYGTPAYIKLDVEGYEFEALQGLSVAPPMLSFEMHHQITPVMEDCLRWLADHGTWEFQAVEQESWEWLAPDWSPEPVIPADYGDIFARRV